MTDINYILDTSAILAHYFDEVGAGEVDRLMCDCKGRIAISVLTITELSSRLLTEIQGNHLEVNQVVEIYTESFSHCIPVNRDIAIHAATLKERASSRLPLIDAVIAATAVTMSAELVHRDLHFTGLPEELIRQRLLK